MNYYSVPIYPNYYFLEDLSMETINANPFLEICKTYSWRDSLDLRNEMESMELSCKTTNTKLYYECDEYILSPVILFEEIEYCFDQNDLAFFIKMDLD